MPFTYLGMPMGTAKPTVSDLMPLVSSVERRLSTAAALLDLGSKLTLVNSVVTSLAIYAMCSIRLPPKSLEHLDKLRRYCLWATETDDGHKTMSMAAWTLVCRPKEKGGLGIINLQVQNQALLLKQLHKFYHRMDLLWVKVVWTAYYNGLVPHATEPCGSFWWKDVLKLTPIFRGISKANVNVGDTIHMWKDLWLESVLEESHPRAFSFALNKDISVKDFLGSSSLHETFHLPLSIPALDEVRDLQQKVLHIGNQETPYTHDTWEYCWGSKEFKANRYYKFYFRDVKAHQSYHWLWKSKVTLKIKMFGWFLLSDRLNTRNMLKRRHYNIGDDLSCLLCDQLVEEDVEHMIFQCPFSKYS